MRYEDARHVGRRLRDGGGYDLARGEMNPAIFEEFAALLLARTARPAVWEPFAGHTGPSRSQDFAEKAGLRLMSFDIAPCDPRVVRADSTWSAPFSPVDGVLFHPPYCGSARMSEEDGELTSLPESHYFEALRTVAETAFKSLVPGGLACAVGRDYMLRGRKMRLTRRYLAIFDDNLGMPLLDVWKSEPDVALIFEKRRKP